MSRKVFVLGLLKNNNNQVLKTLPAKRPKPTFPYMSRRRCRLLIFSFCRGPLTGDQIVKYRQGMQWASAISLMPTGIDTTQTCAKSCDPAGSWMLYIYIGNSSFGYCIMSEHFLVGSWRSFDSWNSFIARSCGSWIFTQQFYTSWVFQEFCGNSCHWHFTIDVAIVYRQGTKANDLCCCRSAGSWES